MALLCMGKRWIPETTDDKSEEGASCKMYADMHFGGLAIYLPRFGSCDLKQLTTSLVFFPFMRSQLSVGWPRPLSGDARGIAVQRDVTLSR